MRVVARAAVTMLVGVIAGCSKSPARPSDSQAAVSAVEISGVPSALVVGETAQLRATARLADGATRDCTATATWRSANPQVASVSPQGVVTGVSRGDPLVTASCSNVEGSVRISVFLASTAMWISNNWVQPLRVGTTVQLTVSVVRSDGALGECLTPVTFRSSQEAVVSITAGGLMTARAKGEATISATCEGKTLTSDVRVTNGITARIFTNDADVNLALERVTIEMLDGPLAGRRFDGTGAMRFEDSTLPFRIRVSSPGYRDGEFVVSEQTGQLYPQYNVLEMRVALAILPESGSEDILGQVQLGSASYLFHVRQPGVFRAQTWWAIDYNDRLTLELRCGSHVLKTVGQQGASFGGGFEVLVDPCDVELLLTPLKRDLVTRFRLRVRYPS